MEPEKIVKACYWLIVLGAAIDIITTVIGLNLPGINEGAIRAHRFIIEMQNFNDVSSHWFGIAGGFYDMHGREFAQLMLIPRYLLVIGPLYFVLKIWPRPYDVIPAATAALCISWVWVTNVALIAAHAA